MLLALLVQMAVLVLVPILKQPLMLLMELLMDIHL
jgi:hypothetical protein